MYKVKFSNYENQHNNHTINENKGQKKNYILIPTKWQKSVHEMLMTHYISEGDPRPVCH